MRTIEKTTAHAAVADIDIAWSNKNCSGVAWSILDAPDGAPVVGGTAALVTLAEDGTELSVTTDVIASNVADVIVYDFPVSKAIFRYTPANGNAGVITSVLTPRPVR
tara:strand:+ start:6936 stop:7256 length:321 start_codon:yes stop_codon:yes gene_type:complete